MTDTSKDIRRCSGCDEPETKVKLERVGLVLMCPACIQEADDIQSLRPDLFGPGYYGDC